MIEPNSNNIVEDDALIIDQKERQPWQQPTLKRLRLSLDTATSIGSATDGDGSSFIVT